MPLSSKSPRSGRTGGFTLIELLTVIAIIGILAAILIPTVGKVRKSARTAAGISNLRQVNLAAIMVATENRGNWWWSTSKVNETDSNDFYYQSAITNYLSNRGVKGGPTTLDIFRDPMAAPGSFNNFAVNSVFFASFTKGTPRARFNRLATVRNPARTVFFGDQAGTWAELQQIGRGGSIWSWRGLPPSTALGNWTHDALPAPYGTGGGEFDTARDQGNVKIAMLDGSVRRVRLNQITHAMVDPACQ